MHTVAMKQEEMYSANSIKEMSTFTSYTCNIYQYYMCTHFKQITAKIVKC